MHQATQMNWDAADVYQTTYPTSRDDPRTTGMSAKLKWLHIIKVQHQEVLRVKRSDWMMSSTTRCTIAMQAMFTVPRDTLETMATSATLKQRCQVKYQVEEAGWRCRRGQTTSDMIWSAELMATVLGWMGNEARWMAQCTVAHEATQNEKTTS